MTTFIETYTGRTFEPLNPNWPDICVEDIAHALSNQCRFSGHCRFRYSVAEHSVRVSEVCGPSRGDQLWGLLHDASEAYLVDIPAPLKEHSDFDAYRYAEQMCMLAVCRRFSLPPVEPEIVRWADATLLATEARDLMHGDHVYWAKLKEKPLKERIRPWAPDVAEYEFLRRFGELT